MQNGRKDIPPKCGGVKRCSYKAASRPGSLIQVMKQRGLSISVNCSEFGGFGQEILNSISRIEVSIRRHHPRFNVALKNVPIFKQAFLCGTVAKIIASKNTNPL